MWRVHRLDQINAFKAANLFDFRSLTLIFWSEQIGRFKTATRTLVWSGDRASAAILVTARVRRLRANHSETTAISTGSAASHNGLNNLVPHYRPAEPRRPSLAQHPRLIVHATASALPLPRLNNLLPTLGGMSEALMKTLWRNSPLLSVTFILVHSGSLWLHLPPSQNGVAGRGQACRVFSLVRKRTANALCA
jgi:hypothetical protein